MAVATYTKTGTKAATPAKLPVSVFGLKVENKQLLKDAYLAYLANGRVNLAITKNRGDVRGGGRKPWRQKGTGRARVGSSRNPIWTGGGVAFGPTGNENYSRRLNVKARRLALCQALSLAAAEGHVKVIDSFAITSGKTKDALILLKKLEASGRIIVTTEKADPKTGLALRNAPGVKLVSVSSLNVYDVMNCDVLVIEKGALSLFDKRLAAEVKAPLAGTKDE